ncbi:MAG: chitin deacetylase [Rhodospirillales bacterium 69-11]|nr:polysaccharide deacetylase family protein [Rhodospirillales bacterium]OJW31286.1 MAG: chitin deacetylase [Rhodospirillales bacterium 69-11]
MMRDFYGYGPNPPDPRWPGGARVAVSFVVNVEEGAELSIIDGDERNEGVYEVNDEVRDAPDPCRDTHFEYGTRVGYWRIMAALDAAGAPSTLNACGRAIARSPWLARDALARGHEIACHGWRWERHANMEEAQERATIARAVAAIRDACGVAPVGWHTRSAPSPNTRRLLLEHGGFLYDSDAYSDDLPFFVELGATRHVVLPYSFDTNDMHFHQGQQRFVTAADFAEYVNDAYDRLWQEGADTPRMLSVGLHLRMIGRAGRIAGLERVLRHMHDRGGAWFARRDAIARHWIARFPPP